MNTFLTGIISKPGEGGVLTRRSLKGRTEKPCLKQL